MTSGLEKYQDVTVEASSARFHEWYENIMTKTGLAPTPEKIWLSGAADMAMCVLVNHLSKKSGG